MSEVRTVAHGAERDASGRWIAAGAVALATAGAAVLLVAVLVSLEYDLEDGVLELFGPAWAPLGLVGFSLVAGGLVFSGVPGRRWLAVLGYGAGAGWLLFVADLDREWLTAALTAAVTWGIAVLALLAPRSVRRFLRQYEGASGRLALPLGSLQSDADARRWVSVIETWLDTGVLTRHERVRLSRTLAAWVDRQEAVGEELHEDIARLAPSQSRSPAVGRLRDLAGRLLRRPWDLAGRLLRRRRVGS